MKFIHAADIHLDSPLTGLSAYADAPVERLRNATREAFTRLIDAVLEEQADFLIIAGDLYDGNWKDYNTGIFFCREMGRLRQENIPVYLLFGNHDAESEMTKKLQLPDNVHVFSSKEAETFLLESSNVALHGQSFKTVAMTENLVTGYPDPVPNKFNIGVLHTALEGNSTHANYAPCTIEELHAKGYNYWALGHVHERQVWQGKSTIVFPGNLQGRHIRETGPRGATLVTVNDEGILELKELFLDVLRWQKLEIDVSSCDALSDVVNCISKELENIAENDTSGMPLALRVILLGKTNAHGDIFGLEMQLRSEVFAAAAALSAERLWIEKIQMKTTARLDDAAVNLRADALSDLQYILRTAETDQDFLSELQKDLLPLVNKAPLELQTTPLFKQIRAGDLSSLVTETRPSLIAHLAKVE